MKKTFVTLVLLLIVMGVTAQTTFIVDGINYMTTSVSTVEVTSGGTYTGNITIPSTVLYSGVSYTVSSIGNTALQKSYGLTSITIPSSVTLIGAYAFNDCSGLKSITIPSSVNIIGDFAFANCPGLTSITIPSSVTSIGYGAFSACTGLKQFFVDIKNTYYTSIEGVLFNKQKTTLIAYPNLKSSQYTIPSSVTKIATSAFAYCSELTSLTIPSAVTSIENYAFTACTRLKQYIVNSSNPNYASLDGVLFNKQMTRLILFPISKSSQYAIPSTVTSIGAFAFEDCSGLTSVTIPAAVKSIGDFAFYNCSSLTSITIPDSVISIGAYSFRECSGLTSITLPTSVETIGDYAFFSCSGLTSISISSSVTSIGKYVFYDCSGLTSITIPSSVSSIGAYAFCSCTGLSEIHCQMITPPLNDKNGFFSVNKNTCKLYVPKGSSGLYSGAVGWSDFTIIIEENVTAVKPIKKSNVNVYSEQNDIVVKGAGLGETIYVYTTMGTLVKTIKATNDVRINVPSNQIYLVKIADKTFKIAL